MMPGKQTLQRNPKAKANQNHLELPLYYPTSQLILTSPACSDHILQVVELEDETTSFLASSLHKNLLRSQTTMALFSAFFNCFWPSSLSRVSNDAMKAESSEKPKNNSKSKSSSEAPIVVSHFTVNSYLSRL
nr:hypothetical protein CFP56_40054 [Quercus suber]